MTELEFKDENKALLDYIRSKGGYIELHSFIKLDSGVVEINTKHMAAGGVSWQIDGQLHEADVIEQGWRTISKSLGNMGEAILHKLTKE